MGLWDCRHGKRHVMYLDDDALPKTWDDFEVEEVNIAVFLADVAGIDEEYVTRGQFLEYAEFDILHFARSKLNVSLGHQLAQFIAWIRVYTRHARRDAVLLSVYPLNQP